MRFGTWRNPCLCAKAFALPPSPVWPSGEVFAWRSRHIPSHGFRHGNLHGYPFDRDIIGGTQCLLHVWALSGFKWLGPVGVADRWAS
uniref:Uncharacterized protein n=1 Tax=Oryza barthii TaxID=65489 RepID=A0A0D3FTH7_9ORYZ